MFHKYLDTEKCLVKNHYENRIEFHFYVVRFDYTHIHIYRYADILFLKISSERELLVFLDFYTIKIETDFYGYIHFHK